jgi:hypothetical protein
MLRREATFNQLLERQAQPQGLLPRQRADITSLTNVPVNLGQEWLKLANTRHAETMFRLALSLADRIEREYPQFLSMMHRLEPIEGLATVCRLEGRTMEAEALEKQWAETRRQVELTIASLRELSVSHSISDL